MSFTKVVLTGASIAIKAGWTVFNNLIDDLLSTASGKGASQIGIQDSAGNLDAANVEDALAEICSDHSYAKTLSEMFAEDSATTVGLTWGHTAGTVRFDNTITDVVAGTISLTDDATNYIEIQADGTISRNTTGFTSGRIPIRVVVCADGEQTSSTDKRSWFQSWDVPLPVVKGGTGQSSFTDGQILIGNTTGNTLTKTTLTETANETSITNGAGSITIGIADNVIVPVSLTVPNDGLHLLDTDASHDLIIKPGSDLTEDRILTITTGDAARTLSVEADSAVNQDLTTDANVQFGTATLGNSGLHLLDTDASHDLIIKPGSDLTEDKTLTITTGDADRGITVTDTGVVMLGDGGTTKAWFYVDTAPTGWTIDNTPADALLAVKGGSAAYNAEGGTQQGTWTQPNHTHSIPGGSGIQEQSSLYRLTALTTGGGATENTWRPLAQVGIIAVLDALS